MNKITTFLKNHKTHIVTGIAGAGIGASIIAGGSITQAPVQIGLQQTFTPITVDPATPVNDVPIVVSTPTLIVATTTINEINKKIENDNRQIKFHTNAIANLQADIDAQNTLLINVTQAAQSLQ